MILSSQMILFLSTVAIGAAAGFIFDIFRISRKAFKHPDFFIQIEDFLYWILVSAIVFYFMLNKNNGEIRIYFILGIFLGMILYFLTASRFVVLVSVTVINFLKKVLQTLLNIILFPIKILLRILGWPLGFVKRKLIRAKKPVKKLLQKSGGYAKMKSKRVFGDLKIIFKKV